MLNFVCVIASLMSIETDFHMKENLIEEVDTNGTHAEKFEISFCI